MLLLLFELDGSRFAIDTAVVREVLPYIGVTCVPHAPPGLAGVCDRGGASVPVVDLCQLLVGRPARRRLSTRIVIVDYAGGTGPSQPLGLVAEKATQLVRRSADAWQASGVVSGSAPYLGAVAADADGFVQRVDVHALLPDAVRRALFAAAVR